MRKLVGVQRHRSSFLLHPCLFLWARTEGCHGDEVGLSPTAWSGKSSSLLWHLPRLEETDDRGETHTGTHKEWEERGWRVSNWQLQKVDGLNDNTCNIRGLSHRWRIHCHCLYQTLLSSSQYPFIQQLLFLASFFICSHLDLASTSVSQHIFPSWSFSLPTHAHKLHNQCKNRNTSKIDSSDTQTHAYKSMAIPLREQPPTTATSSEVKTDKLGQIAVYTTQQLLFHISAQEELSQQNSYWAESFTLLCMRAWACSHAIHCTCKRCVGFGPWIPQAVIMGDLNAEKLEMLENPQRVKNTFSVSEEEKKAVQTPFLIKGDNRRQCQ